MSRNDDGSMVDKVNEKIRDARESLAEKFDDEDQQSTLPLLDEADGQRDQSWWEENVQELQQAIEKYKRKLEEDDDSHRELRLKLEAAGDLLPERNDSGN
jgi:predicted  nucleic acid-binding Zn-ribbon protein